MLFILDTKDTSIRVCYNQVLSIGVDSATAPDGEPPNTAEGRIRPREIPPDGGATQRGVSVPASDHRGVYVRVIRSTRMYVYTKQDIIFPNFNLLGLYT